VPAREALHVNAVLPDLVVQHAFGRVEQSGGLGAIATRARERVLDEILTLVPKRDSRR